MWTRWTVRENIDFQVCQHRHLTGGLPSHCILAGQKIKIGIAMGTHGCRSQKRLGLFGQVARTLSCHAEVRTLAETESNELLDNVSPTCSTT